MNDRRPLFAALAVLGLVGVAAVVALGGGSTDAPDDPISTSTPDPEPFDAELAVARFADEPVRNEVDTPDGAPLLPPSALEKVALGLTGRVVDPAGNPIADAEVRVVYRVAFAALAGQGFGGPRGPQDPNGRRGGRGDLFRPQSLSAPVVSGPDGTFTAGGDVFSAANLLISVRHAAFAPTAVAREWNAAEGDLRIDDLVLEPGVRVLGFVADQGGAPIAGATIRFAPSEGRGGRGPAELPAALGPAGDPGADPAGRGAGIVANAIQQLVDAATSGADGTFSLGPVPRGAFALRASADAHLDGGTPRIALDPGTSITEQRIVLLRAASLSGVVRDPSGQPIAGAEVAASFSRDALMEQFRAQRDQRAAERAAAGADATRGRAFGRGDPSAADDPERRKLADMMAARENTKTDAEGRFALKALPPGPVRIEVQHGDFLATAQDPVDALSARFVELTMQPAPFVAGRVVDAVTGEPIATFGLAPQRARDPSATPDRAPRPDATPDPAREAAIAERIAAMNATRTWLQARLGPAGRLPGRTPRPSAHEDGAFRVTGLTPGTYELDVGAPGYVRTATAAIEVGDGPREGIVVALEPGVILAGRVVDPAGAPVADASVELSLPPPPTGDPRNRGAIEAMFRGGRGPGSGLRVAEARTDADGRFALEPVRPGPYRLDVSARGLRDWSNPTLALAAAPREQALSVALARGARVYGVVTAGDPSELRGARVELVHVDGGRHSARVDPDTGAYEIVGLPSGGYRASVTPGGRGDRREALGARLLQRQRTDPDVLIGEGANVRHDLRLGDEPLGSIRGTVTLNGAPLARADLRLREVDAAAPATPGNGGRRGGGPGGLIERLLSGRTDQSGAFQIASIPPGRYQLVVAAPLGRGGRGQGGPGGRGGGSGGDETVYRELVGVAAFTESVVFVDLVTCQFEVGAAADDGKPVDMARVTVALASEVSPDDAASWRRAPSARSFTLRNGTTGAQSLPPGAYRFQLRGRGIATVTGDCAVVAGSPCTIALKVQRVEVTETTPDPNATGGANRGGAGGGQRANGGFGGMRGAGAAGGTPLGGARGQGGRGQAGAAQGDRGGRGGQGGARNGGGRGGG